MVTREQLDTQAVTQIATLPFGEGLVGASEHLTGQERDRFLVGMMVNQHQIHHGAKLPIDCMDERFLIGLADGTKDPGELMSRVAAQLPGGAVLAIVKAGIAADAAFLRDAKTFEQAYGIVEHEVLPNTRYVDAAHEDCGAAKHVRRSVAQRLPILTVARVFGGLAADDKAMVDPLTELDRKKQERLDQGFYDDFTQAWHERHVREGSPRNFSYYRTDHSPTHGHNASGLLLVRPGYYLAKNALSQEVGRDAFALTFSAADEIADMVGGSAHEKDLLKIAFRDDAFNVANHIVAQGLEVFA